jgi:inner membrane protein
MATLFGHVAIASSATKIGANKFPKSLYLFVLFMSALLSILPDFDVVSFKLGIAYGAEWGHRGATHSIAFGIICSLIFSLITMLMYKIRSFRILLIIFIIYTVSILSHTFLDMLTNGGLGCAVLWPFDQARYFFPVTPIPVSPIGIAPSLIFVIAWEFFLIFPLTAISHTLKGQLGPKTKYIFVSFYSIVLIIAYWIRLK